jgi:hypothetical protein
MKTFLSLSASLMMAIVSQINVRDCFRRDARPHGGLSCGPKIAGRPNSWPLGPVALHAGVYPWVCAFLFSHWSSLA